MPWWNPFGDSCKECQKCYSDLFHSKSLEELKSNVIDRCIKNCKKCKEKFASDNVSILEQLMHKKSYQEHSETKDYSLMQNVINMVPDDLENLKTEKLEKIYYTLIEARGYDDGEEYLRTVGDLLDRVKREIVERKIIRPLQEMKIIYTHYDGELDKKLLKMDIGEIDKMIIDAYNYDMKEMVKELEEMKTIIKSKFSLL